MKVLIIKTSSMGDIIHTLPALTDAKMAIPTIEFDWVVEESFQDIPTWHSAVNRVYPVPLRQWLRNPVKTLLKRPWKPLTKTLRAANYDLVIDAQGLVKSALISRSIKAPRHGLGIGSAREWLATLGYHHRHDVSWKHHAVTRVRQLFAKALSYNIPNSTPHYGIDSGKLNQEQSSEKYVVFLHGTTWPTKHWPDNYWHELAKMITHKNFNILIPWGNEEEKQRAEGIAALSEKIIVLPKMGLSKLASILLQAKALVAVDTGLGHLACALHRPTVSIYGSTDEKLTGTLGPKQFHLSSQYRCSPCFSRQCKLPGKHAINPPCYTDISPDRVWQALEPIIRRDES